MRLSVLDLTLQKFKPFRGYINSSFIKVDECQEIISGTKCFFRDFQWRIWTLMRFGLPRWSLGPHHFLCESYRNSQSNQLLHITLIPCFNAMIFERFLTHKIWFTSSFWTVSKIVHLNDWRELKEKYTSDFYCYLDLYKRKTWPWEVWPCQYSTSLSSVKVSPHKSMWNFFPILG